MYFYVIVDPLNVMVLAVPLTSAGKVAFSHWSPEQFRSGVKLALTDPLSLPVQSWSYSYTPTKQTKEGITGPEHLCFLFLQSKIYKKGRKCNCD